MAEASVAKVLPSLNKQWNEGGFQRKKKLSKVIDEMIAQKRHGHRPKRHFPHPSGASSVGLDTITFVSNVPLT